MISILSTSKQLNSINSLLTNLRNEKFPIAHENSIRPETTQAGQFGNRLAYIADPVVFT